MAFNNGGAAPKISKSFLLGWVDEPFKTSKPATRPPPQPKPSGVPFSTEVIEWIASDGRKGKLKGPVNLSLSTGPVKQANLDKSPEEGAGKIKKRRHTHQSINPAPPGTMDRVHGTLAKLHGTPAKLHATPAPADINAGLWAAFGNLGGGNTPVQQPTQPVPAVVPAANAQARSPAAAAGGDNRYSFTTVQDAELLRRKTENESWAVIGEALGKPKHELQERFKQIKPADWKPKPVETGKNKTKNKGGKEKKQEEKKEPANETSGADNGGIDNIWGADWNYGPADTTAQADKAENEWNKDNSKWESRSNKSGSKKGGSAAGRNNNNNGWSEQPGNTAHGISDVYPDDTFSMDDLALIARLLKRDHKQVWFRLSCAFKDKTGRYIPEEVFRKKLTGQSGK